MTAQAFGGDKKDFLKSIFWIGMCNALLIGALIIALILIAGQWIITLFAETSHVADLAWTYMRLFCLFILARAMSIPITSYLMGCAQTKPQLKSSIL
ncbi:MAG: MATE family efflux transporter, partial [Cohaesibacter sp.]|nr:MATE family efflux transporter [Cohaesibacter sp.]